MVYLLRGPDGVYVGSTVRPKFRLMEHRIASIATPKLHQSIQTHGFAAFTFAVVATCIEQCDADGDSPMALELEQLIMMQLLDAGEVLLNTHSASKRIRATTFRRQASV